MAKKGKIQLIIEETPEEIERSIAEMFEQTIKADYLVLTIKWNIVDLTTGRAVDPENAVEFAKENFPLVEINSYLRHCGVSVIYSTGGIHLNGKSVVPHVHYHLIVEDFYYDKNPSQHRKRFREKNGISEDSQFKQIEIKPPRQIDSRTPKYSTLAYPFKEGIELSCCNSRLSSKEIKFLKDVGQEIYEKSCGLRLRQDKCEERKKNALLELYTLCETNKNSFTNFKQMLLWLDKNYIATLTIEDYPDPKNYKTNCQKIACQLGLLTYSSLCL